ncbi:hypothetical protein ABZX85_43360 [Streptomyces sp. NPDC004539]|uniref:hypothetical protein n=1 Tax=Streptomyces sp. NPDC004539 TaxID=3154280 RepID=UPI0033A93B2F
MAVEVWHDYVARELGPVLAVLAARPGERKEEGDALADPVPGALEWTLPWGMDDGNGLVRVTVFTEIVPESYARRIRVVVAAAARGFLEDGGRLALPRYADWGAGYGSSHGETEAGGPGRVPPPDRELTRGMAEHLCLALGGLPHTLSDEPGGEVGFSIAARPV